MNAQVSHKIDEFFAKYPQHYYDKNQILINAGDEPPGIFHIISGQVRQYDISEQGEVVVVNTFKSPAFFPMSWAINKTPNQYFFEATMSLEVRIAPSKDVIKFLQENNDVTYDLLSRLFSGTDVMQRRMAHLMGGTGRSRVLFELIVGCKRFGEKQKDGSYIINIHEDELAHTAGLSRETVNRELGKLKKLKLLEIDHKHLIVKNLASLEDEIGSSL